MLQSFGSEEIGRLTAALNELRARVAALETDAISNKDEVVELIVEARDELARDRPNRRRIASVLSGVAQVVETAAALGPAYGAVKLAAAQLGISLPGT